VVGRFSERVSWHYVYGMNRSYVELILKFNKTVIVASSCCSIFTLPALVMYYYWCLDLIKSMQAVRFKKIKHSLSNTHQRMRYLYIIYLSKIYVKILKMPLHVSILGSSSGSTYDSLLKLHVEIVNTSLTLLVM
jgi:hypothetical protein